MQFWEHGLVATALVLVALIAVAEVLRGLLPPLRRVGVPASIVAGTLGLLLGPSAADLLPVDVEVLKSGVYHALGIVFIAVSLQRPDPPPQDATERPPSAAQRAIGDALAAAGGGRVARWVSGIRPSSGSSMAFGIVTMVALQTTVGLGLVLLLGLSEPLHPGFGLLLPLGFEQGPGQALSLGAAWEQSGLPDGADVGLIIAALGFGWSVFVGVPLVAWGKARGLVSSSRRVRRVERREEGADDLPAGAAELLTRQLAAIGVLYALTYAGCAGLSGLLSGAPEIAEMVWGFHFMIGALLAMLARPLLERLGSPLHDPLLARIAGVTVDLATVAALTAVQLAVLGSNLVPILLITTVGGAVTLVGTVWLARRAFPDAPFEHCVLWFGMSTGTLPMGLALLRIVDPELESPAPISAVVGSAGAILGVAPLVLAIHPIPIAGWGEGWPAAGILGLGLSTAYLAGVVGLWWLVGGLRLGWSPARIWPTEEVAAVAAAADG